jgi:glycosyltransferase involved in cell wall biosynthesis
MDILMVNASWYPSGGDWTYLESICKIYSSRGHNIIPFAMKDDRNQSTKYDNFFLENINYSDLNKNKTISNSIKVISRSIYSFEAKRKIEILISENHIDLVQLNNIHNIHTPSIISVLKKKKIPIVWRVLDYKLICPNRTFLSGDTICQKCFSNRYYQCVLNKCKKDSLSASIITAAESYFYNLFPYKNDVDAFMFQNEFMKELFIQYGFDKNKCHVIENPYDCSLDIPQYEGNDYILYFGRLSNEKGIMTLLDSMKKLQDIKLKIVGNGPILEDALRFVECNRLENVEFLGAKYGEDLDSILKDALFTVVPSEWLEPSPYVVLQSYAHGKPVLANDIGGLTNLVKDGITGMLSKMKDIDSLTYCIRSMYDDRENTRSMGINARQLVESLYNPERYYTSTMKLFNSLT